MKTWKKVTLATVLAAGVVVAATDTDPIVKNYAQFFHTVPQHFGQTVNATFIDAGTVKVGTLVTTSTVSNGLTFAPSGRGTQAWDFPSLKGSVGGTLPIVCAVTTNIAAPGCAFGDQVLLGIDQPPVNAFIEFTPYVVDSGFVLVLACCGGITDGGVCDQPDATYTATCVR